MRERPRAPKEALEGARKTPITALQKLTLGIRESQNPKVNFPENRRGGDRGLDGGLLETGLRGTPHAASIREEGPGQPV